jgi:hypothetical protein
VRLRSLAALLAAVLGWPAASLLAPRPAWAALDTGTLDVRGASGVARVRALDFQWAAEVEARGGRALFLDVPPGRYELLLEGADAPARTIVVHAARTMVLDVSGRGAEGVRAIEDEAEGTAFSGEWLRDLPTSREAWSVLETTEPVAIGDRMDTGGVWAGTPGRVTAHGTSLAQSRTLLGGADVSDPLGRGFALVDPDLAWLSSVRFATSLLPASESGAGPVLSLSPRRPGARWTGTVTLDLARPEGAPADGPPPLARLDSWRNGALLAAGPIGAKAGLVVGASVRTAERFERNAEPRLGANVRSVLGQLTFQPSERQELRLSAAGQWIERPFAGRAAAPNDPVREEPAALLVNAGWTGRRADGTTAEASLAYVRQSTDTTNVSLGAPVERLLDGPVPQIVSPGQADEGRLWATFRALRPLSALGGAALLDAGVSFERSSADLLASPGVWTIPERLDGIGARIWQRTIGRTQTRWRSSDLAGWVEARTDPARRFSARFGARLEWLRATATGGVEAASWLTVSPRLRTRWRVGGHTALLLGAAQYRHRLPLAQAAFADTAAPSHEVFRWDDRDADGVFGRDEQGPLVARVGPGGGLATVDEALRAPLAREVLVGVERRGELWTARFVGLYRRETRLLETVNIGVTADDYVRTTVPDPSGDLIGPDDDQLLPVFARRPASFGRDQYLLTNVTGDDAWHEGAEITLMRDGERVGLLLGATAHRSDGPNAWRGFRPEENDQGLVGERRDDPNADTFARGRLFSDRAYSIKIAARYAAPGDVRLGAVARYQDGQPFARLVIVRDLPQGAEAIQAIPNGRHRFEFAITLDGRVEKGFRLGRVRLAAVAEAFNLLGNAHEVEEDVVTGPAFRTPTADQPPRVWRFGLRVDLP